MTLSFRRAHLMLQVTVFLWGFTAILGKLISLGAIALVWYRQALSVLVLLGVLLVQGKRPALTRKNLPVFALQGAFVASHWVCFYGSIKLAGIAVAVVCLSAGSLFVSLLEPFVFKRAFRWGEALLGGVVMVGVLVLTRGEARADALGIGLGVASAMLSALFGTINGKLTQRYEPETLTIGELGFGALWLSLVMLVWPSQFVAPTDVSIADYGWLLLLAGGCTVIPWMWSLRVLRALSPFTVALAVNLEPVYSLVLAYILFPKTERLGWSFYAGTLLLVAAVGAQAAWRSGVTEPTSLETSPRAE